MHEEEDQPRRPRRHGGWKSNVLWIRENRGLSEEGFPTDSRIQGMENIQSRRLKNDCSSEKVALFRGILRIEQLVFDIGTVSEIKTRFGTRFETRFASLRSKLVDGRDFHSPN